MRSVPTTATASAGTYQQLYEKLFRQGACCILSIHTSRLLSGILNAANSAAQLFGDTVRVIDSQSVSLGLGFQALAAAEAVHQGLALESVLALLEDVRKRVRVVAMLDTLEYVRRSGRVSWARARLGNLLRIKPFIEVKAGQVNSLGEARTFNKGVEMLRGLLLKQGGIERLAMLHTNAEAEARNLIAGLEMRLAEEPLYVNITSVIGAHIGPRALGFAAVVKPE
jgi:DegV family protein with EDD domain